jgi:hypothetical protein
MFADCSGRQPSRPMIVDNSALQQFYLEPKNALSGSPDGSLKCAANSAFSERAVDQNTET